MIDRYMDEWHKDWLDNKHLREIAEALWNNKYFNMDDEPFLHRDKKRFLRILMNPEYFRQILLETNTDNAVMEHIHENRLLGLPIYLESSVDQFLIVEDLDYGGYIEEEIHFDEQYNIRADTTDLYAIIRLPFIVKKVEVILDHGRIEEKDLQVYEEEGVFKYETDGNTATAEKFKFGYLSQLMTDIEELREIHREESIRSFRDKLFEILDTHTIEETVYGYCDECYDCQGHSCGEKIYTVGDFVPIHTDASKITIAI